MKNMIKPIRIVEVKSEIGAGTRGSSMGIDAIKIAALDFGSPFFKKFKAVEIQTENQLLLEPVVNDYAKRIKGIYALNERIAKEIELEDMMENIGAQIIKEVAEKTNDVAGDGTTASVVLTQAIATEGLKNVAAGANPLALRKGIIKGKDAIASVAKVEISGLIEPDIELDNTQIEDNIGGDIEAIETNE